METKYTDIYVPNLDEPAELEQYIHDLMTKVDKTMHDIELCVDTRLPKPIIKELTRVRCELIAVMTEVRKMSCIVHADQKSVGEMLLRVKRVEIKIDELNKEVDSLRVDVDKNTEHLEEHDTTLEEHDKKLTDYKRFLDRHKKQIAELRTDLTKCTEDLQALTDRVDGHDTVLDEHSTKLSDHATIIDEHTTELANINKGIGELDNRCSTVEQKVETLEECCDDVKVTLDTMNHGIGELDNRTTKLESNVTNITENITNIEENITNVEENITNILGGEGGEYPSLSELKQQIDENKTKNDEQDEKFAQYNETIQNNTQDITSLREDVDKNTIEIGDITTSVEQLAQAVEKIPDNIPDADTIGDAIKDWSMQSFVSKGVYNQHVAAFEQLKTANDNLAIKHWQDIADVLNRIGSISEASDSKAPKIVRYGTPLLTDIYIYSGNGIYGDNLLGHINSDDGGGITIIPNTNFNNSTGELDTVTTDSEYAVTFNSVFKLDESFTSAISSKIISVAYINFTANNLRSIRFINGVLIATDSTTSSRYIPFRLELVGAAVPPSTGVSHNMALYSVQGVLNLGTLRNRIILTS